MIVIDKKQSTVDEWFSACECSQDELVGIKKIDTKDAIIFIQNEDYQRANEFLNKNEIPQLDNSVDILGDVESFDIRDIDWGDRNDVIDTRGLFHFHNKIGKFSWIEDNDGTYATCNYEGRKGYPSYMRKMWE